MTHSRDSKETHSAAPSPAPSFVCAAASSTEGRGGSSPMLDGWVSPPPEHPTTTSTIAPRTMARTRPHIPCFNRIFSPSTRAAPVQITQFHPYRDAVRGALPSRTAPCLFARAFVTERHRGFSNAPSVLPSLLLFLLVFFGSPRARAERRLLRAGTIRSHDVSPVQGQRRHRAKPGQLGRAASSSARSPVGSVAPPASSFAKAAVGARACPTPVRGLRRSPLQQPLPVRFARIPTRWGSRPLAVARPIASTTPATPTAVFSKIRLTPRLRPTASTV